MEYYYKQLEELLSEYGDVFEFWIDGANGGTGYYGGADERRNIDRESYYGYEKIFDIVKKHQPEAVIFSDVGPGSRWVGNESGFGSETNWNTISTNGKFPGDPAPDYNKKLGSGEKGGKQWIPAEVNTTLLWPKVWYYHKGYKPRSLANLMELYYTSIGRGSPLNLGLAINPEGKVSKADSLALINFRKQVDLEFETNLVKTAKVTADNIRGNSKKFNAAKCTDESDETYWATDAGIQKASIEIDFGKATTFNRLLLQEFIALGQRIHSFSFEIETKDGWEEVVSGTTVGYKRVLKFADATCTNARITIETEAPCLTLSNLGIFNAPQLTKEPKIECSIDGTVSLTSDENHDIFYKTSGSDFRNYSAPFSFPKGGIVSAYAIDKTGKYQSELANKEIGISKVKWKLHSVSGEEKAAHFAFDSDPFTLWLSKKNKTDKPHFISINLGEEVAVSGFSYLPCKRGCEGIIYEYVFYLSTDGKNWGDAICEGEFSNIQNNPVEQVVKFKKEVKAKYLKLVSKSTIKNSNKTSVAEIAVFVQIEKSDE